MKSAAPIQTLMLASGHGVQVYDVLASTSKAARTLIETAPAAPTGLWILAHRQTDGIGRRGRAWHQREGDFAATLILPLTSEDQKSRDGAHSFLAALSVRDAVAQTLAGARTDATCGAPAKVQIKWPNDILINGEKCAGLLLELVQRAGRHFLTIGIGINLVSHPGNLPYRATHLTAHLGPKGTPPAPVAVLKGVDSRLAAWRSQWQREGFAPIRAAWLGVAAGLGAQITVRLPDRTLTGRFAGLDESGQLILGTANGTMLINVGDVFFGPPQ
ncbi:MAG: biotin--[acetyl-CoA-carboxylase] ligase [Pseudomonadota bacterium]